MKIICNPCGPPSVASALFLISARITMKHKSQEYNYKTFPVPPWHISEVSCCRWSRQRGWFFLVQLVLSPVGSVERQWLELWPQIPDDQISPCHSICLTSCFFRARKNSHSHETFGVLYSERQHDLCTLKWPFCPQQFTELQLLSRSLTKGFLV